LTSQWHHDDMIVVNVELQWICNIAKLAMTMSL